MRWRDYRIKVWHLAKQIKKSKTPHENVDKVKWLQIKTMNYKESDPQCARIRFKYNSSDAAFRVININGRNRSQMKNITELRNLYDHGLFISEENKLDLVKQYDCKAIPDELHLGINRLPLMSINEIPEPSVLLSESDDENV